MQKSVYSISHGIKFCSLSLQVIDHIYCVAVQTTENTWAVYDMMCLNPDPVCSWLHQPSVCVFERPCKCAFVQVCIFLWRGWSLLITQHVLAFVSSCMCAQCWVFFGSFSVVSWCATADVAVIIHHVLWTSDNLSTCDLPAEVYSTTTQKVGGRKSWVVIFSMF